MSDQDFETRLSDLLRERAEHSVEQFDPAEVAGAAIEGAQQRGPWHGLRRIIHMTVQISRPVRYGLVVAVLGTVLAGGGLLYLGQRPPPNGPSATERATDTPSPTTAPTPHGPEALLGAPYHLTQGSYFIDSPFPWHISFDVPADWVSTPISADAQGVGVNQPESGWGVTFAVVGAVSADPCNPDAGTLDAAAAASAQALVAAVEAWPAFTTTAQATTIGGYPATRIEVSRAGDPSACPEPVLFTTPLLGAVRAPFGSVGHLFQLIVVDVEGGPLVITSTDYPETSEHGDTGPFDHGDATWAASQPQLRAILESVSITMR